MSESRRLHDWTDMFLENRSRTNRFMLKKKAVWDWSLAEDIDGKSLEV